jgi:MFS transporter, CP family, cyanate transporter
MNFSMPSATASTTAVKAGSSRREGTAGALAVFLLVAVNLRLAVVALSPVLTDIKRTEHLSDGIAGLLTTVPLACFGVFALTAPWLTRHLGPRRMLLLAMTTLTAGIGLWLASGVVTLFAGALVAGAGIGIANVVMPGTIKRDFAAHSHLLTGLYTTALGVSGALAAGLTVPLERATGLGWRHTLVLWAIPAILALAALLVSTRRRPRPAPPSRADQRPAVEGPPLRALFADRTAWAVTAFMGLQSLGFYAIAAWLPTLLQDHQMAAGQAGWILSFTTFPAIAAALVTPSLNRRLGDGPAMVAIGSGLCAVGYLGLLADPIPAVYLWATCLGLGQGACISLAIHYMVARAPDSHHTGHLSAMAQGIGYLLACIGPVALGAVHNLTSGWTVPLAALTTLLAIQLVAGIGAARNRYILGPVWRARQASAGT